MIFDISDCTNGCSCEVCRRRERLDGTWQWLRPALLITVAAPLIAWLLGRLFYGA